uniref:GDSL esterase/lipase At1g23500 family n=2 Tax=Cajanus cajan TaxID=3821 RepID=A0A151QUJ9_CAJCA|nr:GDSL esterase/lipase At1g23500 family [Cajanus cajan]
MALGIKDSVPAYLSGNLSPQDLATGVCFASAGSGIDDQTARLLATISQPAQLQMFREYIGKLTAAVGQQQATQIISDGVFLVSAGNNDIAITFTSLALAVPFPIYSAGLVSTASNFFKSIYALGARKVWVLSTLPLGCLPGGRLVAGGPLRACAVFENMLAQSFNGQLSTAVNSIRASYSDYDIRFIDVYTPLYNIIQNPQASGFEDVADACCGTGPFKTAGLCNLLVVCPNPSTYVFWDFAHPTERAYRLVVDSILQSNSMNINASTLSN